MAMFVVRGFGWFMAEALAIRVNQMWGKGVFPFEQVRKP
jgi:hypothetical protein